METEIIKEKSTLIWMPGDELNRTDQLKSAIEELKSSDVKHLLLDLSVRAWLSSSEIGIVMWIFKELESMEIALSIITSSPFVMKTITLTGIDQLLPVFNSREEAIHQLANGE